MDIRHLDDERKKLENKISNLKIQINYMAKEIKKRWKVLVDSGSFVSWVIDNDEIIIKYYYGDDYYTDNIPIKFFEIDDDVIAKKEYDNYLSEIECKELKENELKKENEERRLLKELKDKYESK